MIDTSDGDAAHRRRLGEHLDAMLSLCETVQCRRVQLLAYFGQASEPCGNCDTCLSPPLQWDGTVEAQKILSTVSRLQRERNQKFGAGQIIDILIGKRTEKVLQHRHDELTVFGIGADRKDTEWRSVIRQLLAQGLVSVEGDYGTLVLTDASAEVLGRKRAVMMRTEVERAPKAAKPSSSRGRTKAVAVELAPDATNRFERLRTWRAAAAKEQGVPAYVVFHDATLREIATRYPSTLAELASVTGVGETKLERYGDGVLEALADGG